jgi:hypothetical protein
LNPHIRDGWPPEEYSPVTEQFIHEPFGEQPAAEPRFVGQFERIGALRLSEPVLHVLSLIDALSAEDRADVIKHLTSKRRPQMLDTTGVGVNARRLTLTDRKSILYLSHYADPKGSRDEMAAIFGISRQRVSQIVGAIGCSRADQKLIDLFNRTTPEDLRNGSAAIWQPLRGGSHRSRERYGGRSSIAFGR